MNNFLALNVLRLMKNPKFEIWSPGAYSRSFGNRHELKLRVVCRVITFVSTVSTCFSFVSCFLSSYEKLCKYFKTIASIASKLLHFNYSGTFTRFTTNAISVSSFTKLFRG